MQHAGGYNRQIRRPYFLGRFRDADLIAQVKGERPDFRTGLDGRTRSCIYAGYIRLGMQPPNESSADSAACSENAGVQTWGGVRLHLVQMSHRVAHGNSGETLWTR